MPSDGIDESVAEFESAVGPKADNAQAQPDDGFAQPDQIDAGLDSLLQDGASPDQRVLAHAAQLERALGEAQYRDFMRQERDDFNALVKEAEQGVSEFNLPKGYAERYLIAEAAKNATLRECWDNRYNPNLTVQQKRFINGHIRGALSRLHSDAASIPDPVATADRYAVIAAVRRAGEKTGPEPPPQYGHMSNKEFDRYTKATFGF